jgi:uncharacterized FlaG/YvyC family protein
MQVNALNRIVEAPVVAGTPVPLDKTAENREVVQAVKALNASEMFGDDYQLQFQRDRDTQRMVIQFVNRKTSEVISQIPPEYVLRLAGDIRSAES